MERSREVAKSGVISKLLSPLEGERLREVGGFILTPMKSESTFSALVTRHPLRFPHR